MNTVDPKDATLAAIREQAVAGGATDTGKLDESVLEVVRKGIPDLTVEDIADVVDRGPAGVEASLKRLRTRGFNVIVGNGKRGGIQLEAVPLPAVRSRIVHDIREYEEGTWVRFGVCGDKHLCNMHARLDVLNLLYDFYAAEGITTVYDTGNWIDGECRFNKGELLVHGMSAQINYWIENYPARSGITTKFVAGDDHEGWYQQRECVEIGKIAMLAARTRFATSSSSVRPVITGRRRSPTRHGSSGLRQSTKHASWRSMRNGMGSLRLRLEPRPLMAARGGYRR